MTIGIGGAGSRLALKVDRDATVVNVSQTELAKSEAKNRLLAVVHAAQGQLRGSRKDPHIGESAFQSIRQELLHLTRGDLVVSSTGGGTGNGITTCLLRELAGAADLPVEQRTRFALILPYAKLEPSEFVLNTTEFLQGPLSDAIDSGNTGNIFLFSNKLKFENRLPEDEYNDKLAASLKMLLALPGKNDELKLLDGHIDHEDFDLFLSKPYFNYFTYFHHDPEQPFGKQLEKHPNPLLLPPDNPIEALFVYEVPEGGDPRPFYDILEYFAPQNVNPVFSVVENPKLKKPFITLSLLYSRKPDELVEDFNRVSQEHAEAKVRKSIEQHVNLPKLEVNLQTEARKMARQQGASEDDILQILKRLGKLK